MNCATFEGAEVVRDCWFTTIALDLKLVSVKLSAFALVLPTRSFCF